MHESVFIVDGGPCAPQRIASAIREGGERVVGLAGIIFTSLTEGVVAMRRELALLVFVILFLPTVAAVNCGPTCPPLQEASGSAAAGTYAVVAVADVGGGQLATAFIGTAFAIEARLLTTNAHVVEAFKGTSSINIVKVVGVQAGTGNVVELLLGFVHPGWNQDPFSSADVGLFTTKEEMSNLLTPASQDQVANLATGDDIIVVGFPDDVAEQVAPITPGTTVPQATILTGSISALRNFDASQEVTPATTDVIQHQAPTSPGTSGSAMVRCGLVIAANNAGTIQNVLRVDDQGNIQVDRTPAASNNFAIHVKHLRDLVSMFHDSAINSIPLPPPYQAPPPQYPFAASYEGSITGQDVTLAFQVGNDGKVQGTASWSGQPYGLAGETDQNGNLVMQEEGQPIGYYVGVIDSQAGQVAGQYYQDQGLQTPLADWTAVRK